MRLDGSTESGGVVSVVAETTPSMVVRGCSSVLVVVAMLVG
jgi:hypothetical protein